MRGKRVGMPTMLSAQGTQTVSWITEGLIGILDMSRLNFPNHAQCSGNQNLVLQKALLGIGRYKKVEFSYTFKF